MTEPEKLDLRSHDIAEDKRQEMLRLFPDIRMEGGKVDFERLKLVLGEAVDVGKERYGLTWPGKAECFKAIQTPSMGTLLPCREESVNFDTTENLIIEGDNLEVLKLLQKSYLGKVKLIYIDPPYNTGSDFIYPDNYSESLQTYLQYTGQVDAEGKRFATNTEADGRFHSKWLSMMYPRLYLARNLLREDGLLLVSIDDREVENLRRLCSDIFGEENFIEQVVWKNKYNAGAQTKGFSNIHEYIVCYSRAPIANLLAPLSEDAIAEYKARDSKYSTRGGFVTQPLATGSKDPRPNLRYPITWHGKEIWPDRQWIWSRERMDAALANDELVVNESDGKLNVRGKQYLRDENGQIRRTKPLSLMIGPFNQEGSKEVDKLLGPDIFDFPKPVALIRFLLSLSTNGTDGRDGIVLDFFAGSGTTAHAALELNAKDGGTRKFVLVQMPEPTRSQRQDGSWDETPAWKAGYHTIADITKERVRRVITNLNADEAGKLDLDGTARKDHAFRVFKLGESNFKPWNAEVPHEPGAIVTQLEAFVDHVRDTRGPEDLLYELLLKGGFPLTAPVEALTLAQKSVYAIAGGAMLVCLERELTVDLIRAIANRKPQRIVCLDEGFAKNDQLKANAVQLFKTKGVAKFQTV